MQPWKSLNLKPLTLNLIPAPRYIKQVELDNCPFLLAVHTPLPVAEAVPHKERSQRADCNSVKTLPPSLHPKPRYLKPKGSTCSGLGFRVWGLGFRV